MPNHAKNDLAYWFPRLAATGVPVPRTEIVLAPPKGLYDVLDGKEPDGWGDFLRDLRRAAEALGGYPVFLRTGQTSGKHSWARSCYVASPDDFPQHVYNLVERSELVSFLGLPHGTWAVRELLPTEPICVCRDYDGFPVSREFRYFVRGDAITHRQPYWPPGSVEDGDPDRPDWRDRLAEISRLTNDEDAELTALTLRVGAAFADEEWSVDWLHVFGRGWVCIDMALGAESFRWTAGDPAHEHGRRRRYGVGMLGD